MANHLSEYGKKPLTPEERENLAKKYAIALERTIHEISEKEKVILLVAPATLSKLPDYTEKIEAEVKRVMNEN
jgi:hypothetical protein